MAGGPTLLGRHLVFLWIPWLVRQSLSGFWSFLAVFWWVPSFLRASCSFGCWPPFQLVFKPGHSSLGGLALLCLTSFLVSFFLCFFSGFCPLCIFVMAARVARPNTLVIQCPDQLATMSEHDFMVELFKSTPKAVVRACQFLPKIMPE